MQFICLLYPSRYLQLLPRIFTRVIFVPRTVHSRAHLWVRLMSLFLL